ncbi:MAG: hypothetical protein JWN03_2879 [Nocardia sp.]|nr:hypothetical protein [Nocardia sp.]
MQAMQIANRDAAERVPIGDEKKLVRGGRVRPITGNPPSNGSHHADVGQQENQELSWCGHENPLEAMSVAALGGR